MSEKLETSNYTRFSAEELKTSEERYKSKRKSTETITTPQTAEGREHMRKLKTGKGNAFDKILASIDKATERPQKKLVQKIDFEAARVLIGRICKRRAEILGRSFEVRDANKEKFREITRYFINDPNGKLDTNKGILLIGDVGNGKTFVMDSFAVLAARIGTKSFKVTVCNEIIDELLEAQSNKSKKVDIKRYFEYDRCFDDIGDEETSFKYFGNEIRPMDRILTQRYRKYINGYCLTHGTTNLNAAELEKKYGKRVYDRMKEMFNVILWEGESFRK